MFYEQFEALCAQKGVRPGRACLDMGLSRSLAAKWKSTGAGLPSADVLAKMSAYFGQSIDEILGNKKASAEADASREITDEEIKFALFGGEEEITDEMFDEVKSFAQFVKERSRKK